MPKQKTLEEYLIQQATEEAATADPLATENHQLKRMLLQKYGVIEPQLTEDNEWVKYWHDADI